MWIITEPDPSRLPDTIGLAPDEKFMQVLICPSKGDLKSLVKISDGAIAAHQEMTPDLRTDISYSATQLINLHHLGCATHALPLLQRSLSRVYWYRLIKDSGMVLSYLLLIFLRIMRISRMS
jgi:hypothetical protein